MLALRASKFHTRARASEPVLLSSFLRRVSINVSGSLRLCVSNAARYKQRNSLHVAAFATRSHTPLLNKRAKSPVLWGFSRTSLQELRSSELSRLASSFTGKSLAGHASNNDNYGVPAGFKAPEKINMDDYPPCTRKVTKNDVEVHFVRSGGAGGQNVNKVNTKCAMAFDFLAADFIPDWVKDKIMEVEANRINGDLKLLINSSRHRTQGKNYDDALQKLQDIIDSCAKPPQGPSEAKIKKVKKLAKRANERRLDKKKKASSKKSDRRQNKRGNWD